jgi:WD40 repeat protein
MLPIMAINFFYLIYFMKQAVVVVLMFVTFFVKAQSPQLTLILPVGHTGGVYDAIFSPDYKFILTRDKFEIPRVWDGQTGLLLANLRGHKGWVYRVGYSPDGKLFYTAGAEDSTIIIWITKTATPLYTFKTNGKTVQGGNFNFEGTRFIAAAQDVRTWDLTNGKLLHVFNPGDRKNGKFFELHAPAFNKQGNIAVIHSSEQDGFHRFYWNVNTNELLAEMRQPEGASRYELTKTYTADTSFLDLNTSQWVYPSLFAKQDKALDYDIDRDDVWITDSTHKNKLVKIAAHTAMNFLFYYAADSLLVAEPIQKLYAGAWDIKTMQMARTLYYKGAPRPLPKGRKVYGDFMFNKSRSMGVVFKDKNFAVYDLIAMKELPQFNQSSSPDNIQYAFFSNNDSLLLTTTYTENDAATLWNVASGKPIRSFAFDKSDLITHACFTNDNKWIALFGWGESIKIFETETGKLVQTINKNVNGDRKDVLDGSFSPDKKMIFFTDNNALFRVYDVASGKQVYALDKEPGSYVASAIFTPDNKRMILGTSASINKVIDLSSKKTLYQFFQIDSTDYFTQVPGGYYQATRGAAKLIHYVTPDLKVINFDQLDIRLNRPDKVQQIIGNPDTLLIASYRKAYQKRIKKLGIDTTQFRDDATVPECNIINRENIQYTQSTNILLLKIKAKDTKFDLDRFNVWVNDVPVFGLRGITIKSNHAKNFDTSIAIHLSQGDNRIETTVINANGTESFKMAVFVQCKAAAKKEIQMQFIGIGINHFADAQYNLSWSVKDIRDIAVKLKAKYPNIIIDTLFDKQVTRENVLALKQKLQQLDVDDKVIVCYSGHGILSKDFDYFLSTYNINFSNPEKNGLAYDEMESLLDNIKPRQKLMLIDACHSGEVDKDELARVEAAHTTLDKNGITTRSTIKVIPKKTLGMANSVELMQNLFVNVSKGTGATIISAAGGMQYALERGDLKNGVFTYSIIDAFNNNTTLTVSQLKKIVSEKVVELTRGLQQPTSRNETNNYDWMIW